MEIRLTKTQVDEVLICIQESLDNEMWQEGEGTYDRNRVKKLERLKDRIIDERNN